MLTSVDSRVKLRYLDPWQEVLNIPCWMPFMWETILSYGTTHNERALRLINRLKFFIEFGYFYELERRC